MRRRRGGGGREGAKDEREEEEAQGEARGGGAKMTTMGKQVTRAGHDTPNTSKIASKKAPRGRRCGVSLRITGFVAIPLLLRMFQAIPPAL